MWIDATRQRDMLPAVDLSREDLRMRLRIQGRKRVEENGSMIKWTPRIFY